MDQIIFENPHINQLLDKISEYVQDHPEDVEVVNTELATLINKYDPLVKSSKISLYPTFPPDYNGEETLKKIKSIVGEQEKIPDLRFRADLFSKRFKIPLPASTRKNRDALLYWFESHWDILSPHLATETPIVLQPFKVPFTPKPKFGRPKNCPVPTTTLINQTIVPQITNQSGHSEETHTITNEPNVHNIPSNQDSDGGDDLYSLAYFNNYNNFENIDIIPQNQFQQNNFHEMPQSNPLPTPITNPLPTPIINPLPTPIINPIQNSIPTQNPIQNPIPTQNPIQNSISTQNPIKNMKAPLQLSKAMIVSKYIENKDNKRSEPPLPPNPYHYPYVYPQFNPFPPNFPPMQMGHLSSYPILLGMNVFPDGNMQHPPLPNHYNNNSSYSDEESYEYYSESN